MAEQKKVLLIEDDLALLKIYSNKLKANDFLVTVATTGKEGMHKVVTDKPDIVLLDIILPEKDGFMVLESIKKNPETRDIPVVIMSNLGQEADIKRGKELGAEDYLVKSNISLVDFVKKVKKYLEK